MVLDPIPQPLPVHFFGSRPQPPTSRKRQCSAIPVPGRFFSFSREVDSFFFVRRARCHVECDTARVGGGVDGSGALSRCQLDFFSREIDFLFFSGARCHGECKS